MRVIVCLAGDLEMAKEKVQNGDAQISLLHPAYSLRTELQRAVEKLKDSNRQLQAAIEEGDRDPELRDAIGVGFLNKNTMVYGLGAGLLLDITVLSSCFKKW